MTTRNNNVSKGFSLYCLILVGCIIFSAFYFLSYSQIYASDGQYPSDTPSHIATALKGTGGYSGVHHLINIIYSLTNDYRAIALFESVIVVATWLASSKMILCLYEDFSYFESTIIALPSLFWAGIYIPILHESFYKHQIITQPHHNITYIAMRFCMILFMIIFVKIFNNYFISLNGKTWITLAFLCALSTYMKPSFFYGFALTLCIFLVIDIVKIRFCDKYLTQIILMGSIVFPSICIMLLQSSVLYDSNSVSGIAVIWGQKFIQHGVINTIFKIACGLVFPIIVAIYNRNNLNKVEKFIFSMYGIQLILCIMLTETGPRANHGNFHWGLYGAAFLLTLISISRFVSNLKSQERKKVSMIYLITGSVLLCSHLLSGLVYFMFILSGAKYHW